MLRIHSDADRQEVLLHCSCILQSISAEDFPEFYEELHLKWYFPICLCRFHHSLWKAMCFFSLLPCNFTKHKTTTNSLHKTKCWWRSFQAPQWNSWLLHLIYFVLFNLFFYGSFLNEKFSGTITKRLLPWKQKHPRIKFMFSPLIITELIFKIAKTKQNRKLQSPQKTMHNLNKNSVPFVEFPKVKYLNG